jgi:hypothetical protein
LQFLLMTLGPSFLLLALLDGMGLSGPARPMVVFGRAPLFFYVLHLYLIHALAVLTAILNHQPYEWLLHGGFWFFGLPDGYGYSLPVVYLMWAMTVVLLYWPCRWFADLKQRRGSWWVSYF